MKKLNNDLKILDLRPGKSHTNEVNLIANMLPKYKNIKILDVGGGIGNLEVILESKGYKNITYLDISEKQAAKARKRLKHTRFIIHDALTRLPFQNKSFDIVTCIEVLEHLNNPYFIIRELLRVGKVVILAVPNGFWQEITPLNEVTTTNQICYFAPTWRYIVKGIECSGGKILSIDYFYNKIGFIRRLFPKKLCSSFIIKMRENK